MKLELDISDDMLERIVVATLKDTRRCIKQAQERDPHSKALVKACDLLIAHYRTPF